MDQSNMVEISKMKCLFAEQQDCFPMNTDSFMNFSHLHVCSLLVLVAWLLLTVQLSCSKHL